MKTKGVRITRRDPTMLAKAVEGMLPQIRSLIEEARHRAVTAANLSMVSLYWNIGRIVSSEIQSRPGRADYGVALLTSLAERLRLEYGPGFSRSNLQCAGSMKPSRYARQCLA